MNTDSPSPMRIVQYESERQLPDIIGLIQNDLSEPYSIYTYRYFIHNWPNLCFLAKIEDVTVGVIVCKFSEHKGEMRGYIAMVAVHKDHRKKGIGSQLVKIAIKTMEKLEADEIVLETEETNRGALTLYQNMGFVRDKRLSRYYLNGIDAFRLKLRLR
ncbi:N-alpha-acetyltransferase 30 [Gaertneriomyces sp. JEL0708]|nr:N-alpha-acetyltransferase 30 [Gaertneriomyces sp. JEL0708]